MSDITGQPGELHMTLQITRAATGKTETVELVGYLDPAQIEALEKSSTTTQGAEAQKD